MRICQDASRAGGDALRRHGHGTLGGPDFLQKIIAHGLGKAAAVYTFNNAALELLQHAREHGRFAVMEQTIAPKQIECDWLRGEHEKFPGWEPAPAQDRSLNEFIVRETDEWRAADVIICGFGICACGYRPKRRPRSSLQNSALRS